MFADLGPLPNLTLPAIGAVLGTAAGAWAGWWIERKIRRRRFFGNLAKVVAAKVPERVSLSDIHSHSWSDPARYEQTKAELESLGFQRSSTFTGSPQKWVVEFWLSMQPRLFAKIIDSTDRGIYSEITVVAADGCTTSFENTEDCGLQHQEPDRWIHCGLVSPAQLVERALRQMPSDPGKQMSLAQSVSVYEQSVNESLAWRRKRGFSPEEMERIYERMKKSEKGRPCFRGKAKSDFTRW